MIRRWNRFGLELWRGIEKPGNAFLIRDDRTGAILFSGRVTDPTA